MKSKKGWALYNGIRLDQQKRGAKHLALSKWVAVVMPSVHLWFLSIHRHHKINAGSIDQILLMGFSTSQKLQLRKASVTLLGIVKYSPSREKNMDQNSAALGKWRNKWLTVSALWRHLWHLLTTCNFLLMRLSWVKHAPSRTIQLKTLSGLPYNFLFPRPLLNQIFVRAHNLVDSSNWICSSLAAAPTESVPALMVLVVYSEDSQERNNLFNLHLGYYKKKELMFCIFGSIKLPTSVNILFGSMSDKNY